MRRTNTASFTASALLVSLTAILAQLQIPLPAVPLSLTTLGVFLSGALLTPRASFFAMAAYVLLGALGVPVFSGFLAGPSVLFGPTGGFLLAFPFCAALIGHLIRRFGFSRASLSAAIAAATLLSYLSGTAYFTALTGTGLSGSLAVCVLPFIPGDLAKGALCVLLAVRLRAAVRLA